jgi:hypothetical protein
MPPRPHSPSDVSAVTPRHMACTAVVLDDGAHAVWIPGATWHQRGLQGLLEVVPGRQVGGNRVDQGRGGATPAATARCIPQRAGCATGPAGLLAAPLHTQQSTARHSVAAWSVRSAARAGDDGVCLCHMGTCVPTLCLHMPLMPCARAPPHACLPARPPARPRGAAGRAAGAASQARSCQARPGGSKAGAVRDNYLGRGGEAGSRPSASAMHTLRAQAWMGCTRSRPPAAGRSCPAPVHRTCTS